MKTVRDDFTGAEHSTEDNVKVTVSFSDGDSYFKAEIDASPQSVIEYIAKNAKGGALPFGRYIKHISEEDKKKYNGKAGHYEPAQKEGMRALRAKIELPVQQ